MKTQEEFHKSLFIWIKTKIKSKNPIILLILMIFSRPNKNKVSIINLGYKNEFNLIIYMNLIKWLK